MPRDSLSNDTRDADEHNKPQSKTVTGGTVTDCGFKSSSMIQYATLPHRDCGAASATNQQQGAAIDRGDGVMADGGEPASEEVEIWQFETECWNCEANIAVVYPKKTDGAGKRWELAGEKLIDKDYCNIERTYSKTRGKEVYGNICPECDAHQGNHYIHEIVFSTVAGFQSWEKAREKYNVVDIIEVGG